MLLKMFLKFIWAVVFVVFYFLLSGQENQASYTAILTIFAAGAQILLMWSRDPKSILNRIFLLNRIVMFPTLGLMAYFNEVFYFALYGVIFYGVLSLAIFIASRRGKYLVLMDDFGFTQLLRDLNVQVQSPMVKTTIKAEDNFKISNTDAKYANGILFRNNMALFLLNVIILPVSKHMPDAWVLLAYVALPLVRWYLTINVVKSFLSFFAVSKLKSLAEDIKNDDEQTKEENKVKQVEHLESKETTETTEKTEKTENPEESKDLSPQDSDAEDNAQVEDSPAKDVEAEDAKADNTQANNAQAEDSSVADSSVDNAENKADDKADNKDAPKTK